MICNKRERFTARIQVDLTELCVTIMRLPGLLVLAYRHWLGPLTELAIRLTSVVCQLNPFKPSGVKWLHYKVFKAILV